MSLLETPWTTTSPPQAAAPASTVAATRARGGSWLTLATIDLEAPAVAVVWQWLFTHLLSTQMYTTQMLSGPSIGAQSSSFTASFSLAHALLLAIPVWLVYAADRVADGIREPQLERTTRRHRRHALLRRPIAFLWTALLAAAVALATATLSGWQWLAPLALAAAALLYFLLVQNRGRIGRWFRGQPGPKEAAIGLLFACGVSVFPWTRAVAASAEAANAASAGVAPLASRADRLEVTLALVGFALLCSCNCLLIRLAEGPSSRSALQHRTRRWLMFQTAATLLLALGLSTISDRDLWSAAILLALACLLGVWRLRRYVSAEQLRWLADWSLVTPIVLLLFSR